MKTPVENFFDANPRRERVERAREEAAGWGKWMRVGIFVFILCGPVVSLIPLYRGAGAAYASIELGMIACIAWCACEYAHRREVWFACVARGIVTTFEKTHEPRLWASRAPMKFAYVFVVTHAFVTYLGLDPKLQRGEVRDILAAVLSILAVTFAVLMTKQLVDVEGANALLTVPMFVFLFEDDEMLRDKGMTVVSFGDLAKYVLVDRERGEKFSWNELHRVAPARIEERRRATLVDGVRVARFLRRYKDLKE